MAIEAGSAFVTILPSMRGFRGAIEKELGGQWESGGKKPGEETGRGFLGGFKGVMAAAGGLLLAGGVADFAKGAITEASDLSESMSKVEVVFGKSAEGVKSFASTSATALGQSEAQVLGATGTFGNLLRSVGLTEKESAKFSTSMVGLASDMASFNNTSPEEALEALRAGLVGETEPLKRFGVNLNEAALKAEAMALGIHKGKGPLDANAKAQAAYSLIMKQTALAQGDFERTSGGLANQQRILAAQISDLKGRIGTALLPVLSRVAGFLTGTLIPSLSNTGQFISSNATTFKVIAGVIASILVPALIAWGVQSTIAAAKAVTAWVTAQLAAIKSAAVHAVTFAKMIAGWVAMAARSVAAGVVVVATWVMMGVQSLLAAARMAAAWLIAMGPIGWAIAAIIAIVAVVIMNWDKIKAATARVWSWISQKTVAVWNFIKAAISTYINAVRATIARVFGVIRNIVANYVKVWRAVITAGWRAIRAVVTAAVNAVRAVITRAFTAIRSLITSYVRGWRTVISAAWRAIRAVVTSAVAGVKAAIGRLSSIVGTIRGFFARAKSAAQGQVNSLVGFVRGIPGRISSAIGNLGNLLFAKGQQVISGLVNGIKSKLGAVGSAMGGIAGKISRFLPGSPVKEGPLKSLNRGHAGGLIATMVAEGITANLGQIDSAAERMAARAEVGAKVSLASAGIARPSSIRAAGGDGAAVGGATTVVEIRSKDNRLADFIDVRVRENNQTEARRAMYGRR